MQVPTLVNRPKNRIEPNRWLPPTRFSGMTPDPLAFADAQWQEVTLRTFLGRLSGGISPASVLAAYTDWLTHLAGAPGKQAELASQYLDLSRHALRSILIYGFKRSFFPGHYLQKRHYVRQIIDYYAAVERKHFGSVTD